MNIALLGPSGVGKGTHAGNLITKFDLLHLVTGELFRENVENRAAIGILAKKYISRGELVPDEIVDAMVEAWLWRAEAEKGVLFDGFPRTIFQAKFLDHLFKELNRELDAVIYLNISKDAVLKRLANRIICDQCHTPYHRKTRPATQANICDRCGGELHPRPDDIPEMAQVRLRAFNRVTGPILDYYQEQSKLVVIDGEGEITQVSTAILEALEAIAQKQARSATEQELRQIQSLKDRPALIPDQALPNQLEIVLVGGPGSGKGTQAEHLRKTFNLRHIATGDLFRDNLKRQTDLGKLAKTYMDQGELVPDDVTEAMVEERLSRKDVEDGFILDGFPRTLSQAEALTEIMDNLQRPIDGVLYIKVSDAEIVSRLSGRLICRNCQTSYHLKFKPPLEKDICDLCGGELYQRDDDNPDTIRARLKTFHAQTAPLINYYKEARLLIEIDGEGSLSDVIERTTAAVHSLS